MRYIDTWLLHALHSLAGQSIALDFIFVFFAEYFPFVVGAALVILLLRGSYSRIKQLHLFGVAIISALFARVGVVELLHAVYFRPRPFLTFHFTPLILESSSSFPSGHAAFFFAFAAAVYAYRKRWGIWFFVAALMISIARIIAGVHYPSDILGGAVVGIACGYIVARTARYFERDKYVN